MKLKITVHGVAYEVEVEVLDSGNGFPSQRRIRNVMQPGKNSGNKNETIPERGSSPKPTPNSSREGISSPIAGTIVEINCSTGDNVTKGKVLVVMEAMKMHTSIAAPTDGRIKKVLIAAGDSVRENQMLIELE